MKIKLVLLSWALVTGAVVAEKKEDSFAEELSSFILPGADLKDSKLETVLEALEKSYQKYSDGKSLEIQLTDGATATLTGKIPSQSLRSTLYQIAGQAGMSVSFEEGVVRLSPIAGDSTWGKFQLQARWNFVNDLSQRTEVPIILNGELPEQFMSYQAESLKRAFTDLGLLNEGKAKVAFNPKTSQISLAATQHEYQRVETFLKSMHEVPRQIRATMKVVTGPQGLDLRSGKFNGHEAQTWMRKASQIKGVDILTLPSLVMLPGGRGADLEFIRNQELFDDDSWTGQKLDLKIDLRGHRLVGDFEFAHRAIVPEKGQKDTIESRSLAGRLLLQDGETLVKKVETTKGRSEFIAITVEIIDATGRRINSGNHGIGPLRKD